MKQLLKKIVTAIILFEAKLVLKKYKPRIVAITGSVGKTSVKDAVFTVLSKFYFVRKSAKSFNSEIGVPLTILGCPNGWNNPFAWIRNILEGAALIIFPSHYPEWLVLEVGVDKPGDMDYITSWIHPDVAVMTRLSKVPVHVEFFSSPQAVMQEKGKLLKAVKPDGVVVLNGDDEDVLAFRDTVPVRTIVFSAQGTTEGGVTASQYSVEYAPHNGLDAFPVGITFELAYDDTRTPVSIRGTLGTQHIYTALAAMAVGVSQGLEINKLARAFLDHEPPPGRLRVLEGVKKTVILDDTYNSSPVALDNALETLGSLAGKRKIAVLGDMLELGKYSVDEHRNAGAHAAKVCQWLLTVGVRARFFAEGALSAGMKEKNILRFEDSRQAGEHLKKMLRKGDVALVKGSQSVRMERAVEVVLEDQESAPDVLVRQEHDWLKR